MKMQIEQQMALATAQKAQLKAQQEAASLALAQQLQKQQQEPTPEPAPMVAAAAAPVRDSLCLLADRTCLHLAPRSGVTVHAHMGCVAARRPQRLCRAGCPTPSQRPAPAAPRGSACFGGGTTAGAAARSCATAARKTAGLRSGWTTSRRTRRKPRLAAGTMLGTAGGARCACAPPAARRCPRRRRAIPARRRCRRTGRNGYVRVPPAPAPLPAFLPSCRRRHRHELFAHTSAAHRRLNPGFDSRRRCAIYRTCSM
jgi:hypothetical protein